MVLGEDYLDRLDGMEIIIKTPGIHPNTPQLVRAAENNAIVTSEMEIFVSHLPVQNNRRNGKRRQNHHDDAYLRNAQNGRV